MPPSLRFTAESWKEFRRQAEAAYPFEGCGLLLGPLQAEKIVRRMASLKNKLRDEGRGRFDFAFSSEEFLCVQLAAERDQLDVVGLYHTHPDHPPSPSPTDISQPMLAGWINVIASVHGGQFKDAKAWWREDEHQPFTEVPLLIG